MCAARSSRAALERYLHYYTRYTNHNNSLKLETEAKIKMEAKIKDMEQIGDNTWMDCLYLNEARAPTTSPTRTPRDALPCGCRAPVRRRPTRR